MHHDKKPRSGTGRFGCTEGWFGLADILLLALGHSQKIAAQPVAQLLQMFGRANEKQQIVQPDEDSSEDDVNAVLNKAQQKKA